MATRLTLGLATMGGREGRGTPRRVRVTHGAMLGEVRFWSEAEWAALPAADRPRECAHKPGVGWLAMVPIACMY